MTRMAKTELDDGEFDSESQWLNHLQSCKGKLAVHIDLEKELSESGFRDGDEVPLSLFIPSAVPLSMEDKFTES